MSQPGLHFVGHALEPSYYKNTGQTALPDTIYSPMPLTSPYSRPSNIHIFHLSTENTLGLFVVVCALFVLIWTHRKRTSTRLHLPPSPSKHWFWGNRSFFRQPYRHVLLGTIYKQQLGDIISLITPFNTKIVVNTIEFATELLEKNAAATSDRPQELMANEILGWSNAVGFHTYNERHKKLRRVLASALHPSAARSYAPQHLDSAYDLLRRVVHDPNNLIESINTIVGSFILRLAYGYTVTKNDPLLNMVHQAVTYLDKSTSNYYLVNDFPILKHLPAWFPGAEFQRFGQEGRILRDRYANEPFETVFNQIKRGNVECPSYTSQLLEDKGGANATQDDIDLVKWTAASLFTAGSGTTVAAVSACFLLMSLYPEVVRTAQTEIDTVVGREGIPELKDRDSLPYVNAVFQEIMRICPVAPFGLTHQSTEELEFRGYRIPKGASINANIWAMSRDPLHYSSPHKFDPTRFLKATPELDPRKYIFGFGRRICPGLHVANNSIWVIYAGILATLNIRPSPQLLAKVNSLGGRESERLYELCLPYGIISDPLPFSCIITPRDSVAAALIRNSA